MPPVGSATILKDRQEWIEVQLNPAVVEGWLNKPESNAGLRIYPLAAKEKGEYVHLRSSDWPDRSMRPKLVLKLDMSDEVAGQYWRTIALRVLAATEMRLQELEVSASSYGNPPRTATVLEELGERLMGVATRLGEDERPAAAAMTEAIKVLKAMQGEVAVTSDSLTLARGAAANEARGLATDFSLGVADSMTNVLRVPGLFQGEFTRAASLALAKNEFEPVQVCIVPVDADVKGAAWSATDLEGPGAVIPRDDIEVSVVGYMKSIKPALPTEVAWWPAPILDFMDTVDVPRGEVQPLWVCVRTREDTPAGVYRGTLTVSASGLESKSVDLEVRVFDFAVPKEQHLLTVWGNNEATLKTMYGDKYDAQMAHDFFQLLIDHRQSVNSLYAPQGTGAPQGGVAGDRPVVGYPTLSDPAELKALWDAGCRWWNLGYLHPVHAKDAGMEFEPYVPVFIERVRESLRVADAAGWPRSNMAIYCFDETRDFETLAKAAGQVKTAFPDIAIMTTGYDRSYGVKDGPIDQVMDIWCPLTPRYVQDWDLIKQGREKGKKAWWYVCCGPRGRNDLNFFCQYPVIRSRLLMGAATWKYQPDGFLYYRMSGWRYYEKPIDSGPLTEWKPYYLPGPDGDGEIICPGPDGPLTTIQFENIRDGCEDFEYWRVLQDRLKETGNSSDALVELLTVPPDLLESLVEYSEDPATLRKHRRAVAEAIERAGQYARVRGLQQRAKDNQAAHVELITGLFFDDDERPEAPIDDPIVRLAMSYASVVGGAMDFEAFGKTMADDQAGAVALWQFDNVVMRNEALREKWFARFDESPADRVMDGLFDSLTKDSHHALAYVLMLVRDCDGTYGEYLWEKVLELLRTKPEVVLSRFRHINSMRDFVLEAIWVVADETVREELIDTYEAYASDEHARVVLGWVSEEPDWLASP
jgi:hypothetical protein